MSNKIPYNKPYLSIDEQIKQLKARNMQFLDKAFAKHYLSHLNYYRLTAYWLPYEENHTTHRFEEGTTFEEVYKYYKFDRELRVEDIDTHAMGFPEGWLEMEIWKEV